MVQIFFFLEKVNLINSAKKVFINVRRLILQTKTKLLLQTQFSFFTTYERNEKSSFLETSNEIRELQQKIKHTA